MSEVWVGEHGSYDSGGFEGVFADEDAALTWLRRKHAAAVSAGKEMEAHEYASKRRGFGEGWWLPTPIERDGESWKFDETKGGAGHGCYSVRPVPVQGKP